MSDPRSAVFIGAAAALGACVGSFLNVVAYRLPRRCMSIARPRSRCPRCAAPIAWYQNVPVLSWIALRGRCASCKSPISVRYPLVELFTAALFTGLMFYLDPSRFVPGAPGAGAAAAWIEFGVHALIASALIALTLIDIDYRILPDEITISGIVGGPILAALAPRVQPTNVIGDWRIGSATLDSLLGPHLVAGLHGVIGAIVAGGTLWLIGVLGTWAFKKDAMGFGDVKMIAAMGGVLGFWALFALILASFAGAIIGIGVKLARKESHIPFGPFLALGMLLVMLWGEELLGWWLRFLRWR